MLRRVDDLRAAVSGWKATGQVVGVVPTMGALHAGHISLVRAAKRECDRVIVTIFVNPTQFNNSDDLKKYPRTEASDLALLADQGVDAIFAPPPEEVYPPGFATKVIVGGVSGPLEGERRPGHFEGVATVVAKLFGMTMADRGYFGQKDWQQLQVIRRLVADLNIPVQVIGCETMREADGLAMSSRNARLDAESRARAAVLPQAMAVAAAALRMEKPPADVLSNAMQQLLAGGFDQVEYIELRDAASLEPVSTLESPSRLLAAAWIGGVRLIDNIPV